MAMSLRLPSLGALRGLGFAAGYTFWLYACRLLAFTLITYFLMSATPGTRFQDITDFYGSNEIVLAGTWALLFVVVLRIFNPASSIYGQEIINRQAITRRFLPGFLNGAAIALGLVIAFILSGLYKYLGFFIQPEEAPLAIASAFLRTVALLCLAYCEEFVFRHKIMNHLRKQMPDLWAVAVTSVFYAAIKCVQFELGWMHILSLFLVSASLGLRAILKGEFARGAGFWAAILIVLHPWLSVPILGSDFQGILMVKYEVPAQADEGMARFLTGGVGGPLSSFALQLLFLFDIGQCILRNKRIFWNSNAKRLR